VLFLTLGAGAGGTRHPLRPGQITIGRSIDCDIVVNDESVSRRHAQIAVSGTGAVVRDLSSSNGVFKNGERVSEAAIAAGDRLRFGSIDAIVETGPATKVFESPQPSGAMSLSQTVYRRPDDLARGATTAVDAQRVIRLLAEVGRTLTAGLSLDDTLDRVVTLLMAHVPAERAMITMRGGPEGPLVPRVARSKGGDTAPFAVSRTVTDLVSGERAAILTADVRQDQRFDAAVSLVRDDVRSLMCAPIVADGGLIGMLYVDTGWQHQFSVADLELFTALADYASVAIAQARLAERIREEERRRERLSRYHSPAVVDRVLRDDRTADGPSGQERDVTILFVDIVKFTTMAEQMPAEQVVEILNQFFSRMTEVVFANDGTVDKFIGDAMLAVFGAPIEQADHARRAVATARAMQAALGDLNARAIAPKPLVIRVGLHSGVAIVGDVGSPQRLEYTVVGDVVNTAARLQGEIARPGDVVLSRATLDRAGEPKPEVEPIGMVTVRGRVSAIEAFRLVC